MQRALGDLIEPLTGRRWTGADTERQVARRLAAYTDAGLRRGDRVFLHFGNCLEFFAELLAIWHAGGCAVPIDPRFTAFEIETLAAWTRPRLASYLGAPDADAAAALGRTGVALMDVMAGRATPAAAPPSALRLDDDALILFTSGTTGQPKGVVHTHRSLLARWTSLRDHLGLDAYTRTLCLLPTHFGHGLICNCLYPWLSGNDLYVIPPFKPDILAQLGAILDEHRITFMSSVPSVWRLALRIAAAPKQASLARVFIGSAPLSASLWDSVRQWTAAPDVFNAYGITETGSWLAGTTVPGFAPEDGLVGKPWGGELFVSASSEPATGLAPDNARKANEAGHVWVRTPALMRGYLDRDDLTGRVVSGGWFLTGDIGLVDERGWLYLRGREREEINKGGMKVHPADIDSVIERFPATRDVCAFAFPEALLGEDVGVAVVLSAVDDKTVLELYDWTTRHLARHQVPQRWYLVADIPRTSRGKVSRPAVAEHCGHLAPLNIGALRARAGSSRT